MHKKEKNMVWDFLLMCTYSQFSIPREACITKKTNKYIVTILMIWVAKGCLNPEPFQKKRELSKCQNGLTTIIDDNTQQRPNAVEE